MAAGAVTVVAYPAGAVNVFDTCSQGGNSGTAVCRASGTANAQNIVSNIISLLLWIIGVVSVIMIVIGGFKYVTSSGDSNKIQSAKNTILYSIIGLVVAIVGQGVVLYVVNWIT